MARRPRKPKTLKGYESKNLIFFLCFILALGGVGAFVFHTFKEKDKPPEKPFDPKGILSEVISTVSDSCYFYLGTDVSPSTRTYHNRREIPAKDDGLVKGLFDTPGIVEVVIDKKLIVLTKDPKAHWEAIQPPARELIKAHLHIHP